MIPPILAQDWLTLVCNDRDTDREMGGVSCGAGGAVALKELQLASSGNAAGCIWLSIHWKPP